MMDPLAPTDRRDAWLAGVCAGLLIGHHVGSKAVRDALFLSAFDVSRLPAVIAGSAVLSLVLVFSVARLQGAWGPRRVVPLAAVVSAGSFVAWGALAPRFPGEVAIALYLQVSALGAILVSGFWSVVNERFDPRTARRVVGRIGAGGALGGLVGGLAAERAGTYLPVPALLPALAGLHVVVAILVATLASRSTPPATETELPLRRILPECVRTPYLRSLATLVLVGAVATVFLDFTLKSRATERLGSGEELLRFFALFYAAVGLLTFLAQAGLAGRLLERLGLAGCVATLPAGLAAGGLASLVAPGLVSATGSRGVEGILRSSPYRAGYEPLYVPLPAATKRPAKQIIDVGVTGLGDVAGGGIVAGVLALSTPLALPILAGLTLGLGLAGLWITRRVHRGWIQALEGSLQAQRGVLPLHEESEATRTAVLRTLEGLPQEPGAPAETLDPPPVPERDEVVDGIRILRGRDPEAIRRVLERSPRTPATWIPHILPLLAWDEVVPTARMALQRGASRHTGQLLDGLLDPDTDFTLRRRLPSILASVPTRRCVEGLLEALHDPRFEVRYRCARALRRIAREDTVTIPRQRVLEAVEREIAVGRGVWENQRLLDSPDDTGNDASPAPALDHVFTLLAVAYPRRHLGVAHEGILSGEPNLRGTALEYLESILPPGIRDGLWPFLEAPTPSRRPRPDPQTALDRMLRSQTSLGLKRDPEA